MSSLLEQAIVDAATLKEAALKNAESAILEKYSSEVKGALNSILNSEGQTLNEADASFMDDVPLAHEGEELDGPAEDEIIEIDFDDLKARLHADEEGGEEPSADEMFPHEEVATDLLAMPEEPPMAPPGLEAPAPDLGAPPPMELQEDTEITDEMLEALAEQLAVDIAPQLGGWASMAAADTQEQVAERAVEEAAAAAQSEEVTEEKENNLKLYESAVFSLRGEVVDLKGLLREAKVQLNHVILANAKLVYQNKALSSPSLNERQKQKIVEAVNNANTVEEAKGLFDTLHSAVGTSGDRRRDTKSLREAVSRPTTSMLLGSRQSQKTPTADPNMDRMLRLAGIK